MVGEDVPQVNVPKEIVSFFRGEAGRTFIIKGKPRCGKTTFALQIAHELVDPANIYYIATRGSNEPLYGRYPWLKAHDERIKALQAEVASGAGAPSPAAGQKPLPPPPPRPMPQQSPDGQPTSARALLESILKDTASSMQQPAAPPAQQTGGQEQGFTIDRGHINVLLQGVDHKDLEAVYRGCEKTFPTKSLLMINRIDRLASKYGVDMEALVRLLIRDLVLDANTNLVLVLNKMDSGLDHLADGIITMKEFGGGMVFIGQLELNKLSGVQIKQNKYLYNLLDGKFKLLKGITHWG